MDRTGAETVTERYSNVIFCQNLANFIKMGVKEVFLIVDNCPAGHYRASA